MKWLGTCSRNLKTFRKKSNQEIETPRRNQTETKEIQDNQSNWNTIKECFMNELGIRMSLKEQEKSR